ncbi:ATP-binding protein [Glutamicibacter sp. MNS18]|uniref:sensor histidine kinase n=1 Tax=Glutamicibacter sp. MNS18 TaxID=2989817 RepID=UPI00223543C4|nr:ATP-binding protein [Glutamicibacter sp. MNS18]MCW4465617.1 ATP-binding protein [Glutamicibacter sp. MNS18]
MGKTGNPRRLRARILLLQLGIVLGTVLLVSLVVMRVEIHRVEEMAFDRVETAASELAGLQAVQQGMVSTDPVARVAPIASMATAVSGVYYVTIADMDGIRVAHQDPGQIGQPVSSEHEDIRQGGTFRGIEQGPLGLTLRVKEPIYHQGQVVGTVSVGVLQSTVRANLAEVVWGFAPWIILAAGIGTIGAGLASRAVYRIYGVAPEQVGSLLQAHQAVLFSIDEGVLGVDREGTVTLVNREARRLLDLPEQVVGQPMQAVLDSGVVQLLRSESPQAEMTQTVLSGERVLIATRREALVGDNRYGRTLTVQDRTELENTLRELRGQKSLTDTLRAQAHEFTNQLHLVSGLLSIGEIEEATEQIQRYAGTSGAHSDRPVEDPMLAAICNAQLAVAREAGVELRIHPGTSTKVGWKADEDVATVTSNLLSNAIEAAGDGGVVSMRINAGVTGVRIEVKDSGPGIDPDQLPALLRMGYSSKLKPGVAAHSRGIGLTLVDRIITRRQGVLRVERADLGGAHIVAAWPERVTPRRGTVSENGGTLESDD